MAVKFSFVLPCSVPNERDVAIVKASSRSFGRIYITRGAIKWRDLCLRRLVVAIIMWSGVIAPPFQCSGLGTTDKWKEIPRPLPMPEPIFSGYAPVNDIQLYYAIFGKGKPLILLHGGLGNMENFGNQIPAFANDFEVIAVDSRGHGRSTRSRQPYSYALMASDVIALMDYLQVPKASIVGWSDGAIIGLDIAIRHPERVDKLVALAANFSVSGLREEVKQNATFNHYFELAKQDYNRLSSTPDQYHEFLAAIRKMWRTQPHYSAQQLASIKSPTLIMDGEYDEVIKRSHTEELSHLIPNSKLEILHDVSHFAMFQNPNEFNSKVLAFLDCH
jgi:pimeloyl-ACP methyl ester carboxylesterase